MAMGRKSLNIQVRVENHGGWIPIFQGESQGRALERVLPNLEQAGYKVAFIVPDKFSVGKKILNFLLGMITLGFYCKIEGLLIIGERVDAP